MDPIPTSALRPLPAAVTIDGEKVVILRAPDLAAYFRLVTYLSAQYAKCATEDETDDDPTM